MSVNVNPKLLSAVAMARNDGSDKRRVLEGVYIKRHMLEGVLIVATNGHIITVAHDITGTTDYGGEVVFDLRKFKPTTEFRKSHTVNLEERFEILEIDYPDWKRVIPDFKDVIPSAVVGYSSNVFNQIIKTCNMLDKPVAFTTFGTDHPRGKTPHDPILFRYSKFPNIFSIVMPCTPAEDIKCEIPFMLY